MPVIFLPPLMPTPPGAAEGVVQMRVCARAGVHARSCAVEEGLCSPAPQATALSHARDHSSLCFFIIIIFRLYLMLENPALVIRKFKFLLRFSYASYFLDPSTSNVAFSCRVGSGINPFSLFPVIYR